MTTPSRNSLTNQQKMAIRKLHRERPAATQKQLADWFSETYNHRLSQSTLSGILSSKYDYLDADTTEHTRNAKRIRLAKWPDLEAALLQWITLAQQEKIPVTHETIREKARLFWAHIPTYQGESMPSLSNGWLAAFQNRGSIGNLRYAGKEKTTPESAMEAMINIRQMLKVYQPKDIFNYDEAALYWRRAPDRSLPADDSQGKNQQKSKITALFCCNSDGSEKLHPWFIGTAQNPRSFAAAQVNINNFNLQWRSNTKALMTVKIFEEWLRWFDNQMVDRNVVLLLDDFSAHKSAVKTINHSASPLQNTLIIWVPATTPNLYQPLNLGIIKTWKGYWKSQWVRFMVAEFYAGRDPVQTMSVLQALKWAVQAWECDVPAQTITNCFNKALMGTDGDCQLPQQLIDDLIAGMIALRPLLLDPMSVENFLNPTEEVVQDSMETIDNTVLSQFLSGNDRDSDDDAEPIPEAPPAPIVSIDDALRALQTVILYEMQQAEGDRKIISDLSRHERKLQARKLKEQKQNLGRI